jgi:glyoxylase-like metal-dependent hydrolase (beta-lactamase superfamily II)
MSYHSPFLYFILSKNDIIINIKSGGCVNLKVKRIVVGELEANCYIVSKDNKAILIDPGASKELILNELKDLDVVEILVTHHHFDHIGCLEYFLNKYNLKENDYTNLFDYEVINTPGHTIDSKSFYFKDEKIMFTGDFLFKESIGRTDLPTGDLKVMKQSLEKISKYDDDIIIYPGHGEETTLKNEKVYIPYYLTLKEKDL